MIEPPHGIGAVEALRQQRAETGVPDFLTFLSEHDPPSSLPCLWTIAARNRGYATRHPLVGVGAPCRARDLKQTLTQSCRGHGYRPKL